MAFNGWENVKEGEEFSVEEIAAAWRDSDGKSDAAIFADDDEDGLPEEAREMVADFDGERTWYDVGVGFSCTLSENSYMFINYERSLGHDIDNTWEVSAGASMEF